MALNSGVLSGRTGEPSDDFCHPRTVGLHWSAQPQPALGSTRFCMIPKPLPCKRLPRLSILKAGTMPGRHCEIRGQHLMTMLPADDRADLQKLEKIAGEPASLETEEEFESLFSKLRKGSDAAIWRPLRFADLRGQKIDPGRLHRFRSGHSHRRHQTQGSWLRADREAARRRPGDQGASHPASLILQVKKIGVQCGCGLPLSGKPNSRTWSVGEQQTSHERSRHNKDNDASPTTSSTYYLGLNCVMLWWGQRF
jgi:hypothetical protein